MTLEFVWKLFVLNSKEYGRQTIKDGKVIFYKTDSELTKDLVKKHLAGDVCLSVFPVLNGQSKWFCIDIDLISEVYKVPDFTFEDLKQYEEELLETANTFKSVLKTKGMKGYIERTGGKGIHVWVFFDPAVPITNIVKNILPLVKNVSYNKKIFNVEFFPISENSKSVKLPGGRNLRWGDQAQEKAWSELEVVLEVVETVSPKILFQISNPLEAVFTRCRAYRELKEKADVEKNLRHVEREAIGYLLRNLDTKFIEFTEAYYFQGLTNYDPDITRKNLINLSKYGPPKCSTLQEKGICSAQCKEIGNYKSPIEFYHMELREARDSMIDQIQMIIPQDNFIKKNNCFCELVKSNNLIQISNFIIDLEKLEEVEEGDEESGTALQQTYSGKIVTEKGENFNFKIDRERYVKNDSLLQELYKTLRIGEGAYIDPKQMDSIRKCTDKFSKPELVKKTRNFGFNADKTVYYTPSVKITKDEIVTNTELIVELPSDNGENEKLLDLALADPARGDQYWKDFFKKEVSALYTNINIPLAGMAFTFDAFIKHFYGAAENDNPYILWFNGPTGLGKSRLLFLIQRLFGKFVNLYNFQSSAGRLEMSGYFFKDAIFAVDDFKHSTMSEQGIKTILGVMQNYSDRTGRSRLTRDIKAQKSYNIRGNLLMSGEDIIEREASTLARTIIISMVTSDVIVDSVLYTNIQEKSIHINEWTPSMIQWCLNLDKNDVRERKALVSKKYQKLTEGKANAARITLNFSKFVTAGLYAIDYIYENDPSIETIRENFENYCDKTFQDMIGIVEEEGAANRFWNTMTEMLATGKIRIASSNSTPDDAKIPIIGFMQDMHIYIIQEQARKEVVNFLKGLNPLAVSNKALKDLLHSGGYYTSNKPERKYLGARQVRCYEVAQSKNDTLIKINGKEKDDNKTQS